MWNVPLPQALHSRGLQPWAGSAPQTLRTWCRALRDGLALPFELARQQHAAAVRFGVLPRSMLESQRFEQRLGAIERLALGPLARQL